MYGIEAVWGWDGSNRGKERRCFKTELGSSDASGAVATARMWVIARTLGAGSIEGLRVGWVKGSALFDVFHGCGQSETARFIDRYFDLDGGTGVNNEHVV